MVFKKVVSFIVFVCFSMLLVSQPISPSIAQMEDNQVIPDLTLEQAKETLSKNRGFFTENKGQWDEDILFVGDTDFGKVAFTREAIYYQKIQVEEQITDPFDSEQPENDFLLDPSYDRLEPTNREPPVYSSNIIELSFVRAGIPEITGLELLPHYHNYFIGNDSSKWGIECRNFAQVTYTNIWEGIDLAYFFSPEGLKYEYYVHPHAQIEDLRVKVHGAELSHNNDTLRMDTFLGTLKDDHLVVFGQDSNDSLNARFSVEADMFSFTGIPSERSETIVIDPLVYSTYLGGSGSDYAEAILIDNEGCTYVGGWTWAADFPINTIVGGPTAPGYDQILSGSVDAFVVKLDASGMELLYSTFLGGSSGDVANSIAVDSIGNTFITGYTGSFDFPMDVTVSGPLAPGYDQSYGGGFYDAFIIKINASGTQLLYSSYLGGSDWDQAFSVAIDSADNAYITGYTLSSDFPMDSILGGSLAPGYNQTFSGVQDAFVVKLNSNGTQILYSTFLGGSLSDVAVSIAIDSTGNAYIAGQTLSSDFPVSTAVGGSPAPGYDQTYSGDWDAFVIKLNPGGTQLLYASYLGGSDIDGASTIAIDLDGNAYISGLTRSFNFPMSTTVGGSPAPGYDQTFSAFPVSYIVKLNASGTHLLYSSFLGGNSGDSVNSIVIDPAGNAYIAGLARGSNFPMSTTVGGSPAPGYDQTYSGDWDAFVVKLNPGGTQLMYSTYIGGGNRDQINSIAIDPTGNVYIAGQTLSSNFPMSTTVGGSPAPGYDQTYNGGQDAFVVKLDLPKPILDITATANASSYTEGTQPILTITLSNIGDEYAHSCEVLVTLPPELQFLNDQFIASTPAPGNSRLFQVGGIPAGGSIAFPVFTEVIENVPTDTTVTVSFDASCEENTEDSTTLDVQLIHVEPYPPCPNLTLDTAPNKPNYYYGDLVYLNVTLRNLGGQATGVQLELDLPPALSYAGCDTYRAVGQGQHQTFTIGTMEPDSTLRFVIYAEVITDVKVPTSSPILLELTANECDSFARRLINIKLEPKRTGQQNLDLSVKLLNLEFDEDTGKYYLPYDQTLELQLQVSGYETHYSYTIHWGDGETTTLKNETSSTILLKHKFTAKGTMHLKITIQDPNGREKTSTMYVTVK